MNRAQKMAWLLVITISLAVMLTAAATTLLYFRVGMPRAMVGIAFIGIAGLGGLGPIVFKKDKGAVAGDERDRLINRRAALTGFLSSYLFVGLVCMIPFAVLGPDAPISVNWLPLIFGGAFIIAAFAHSVAILVQYGWTNKEQKS